MPKLVRIDDPSIEIRGTSDLMLCCTFTRPIKKADGTWWFDYDGDYEDYAETCETQKDTDGSLLMLDENGNDVSVKKVGVLLEDGTVVPLVTDGQG